MKLGEFFDDKNLVTKFGNKILVTKILIHIALSYAIDPKLSKQNVLNTTCLKNIYGFCLWLWFNISKVANDLARTMTQCSELSSTIIVSYRDSFFLQKKLWRMRRLNFIKSQRNSKKLEQLEILKKRIWSLLVPTHLFIVRY